METMIKYEQVQHRDVTMVKFSYPDKMPSQYAIILSPEQLERALEWRTKNYILARLSGWLKQREFAVRMHPEHTLFASRMKELFRLSATVAQLSQSPLINVLVMVTRENPQFEYLAPQSIGQHRKHFENVIMPILNYCKQQTGGVTA